MDGVGTYDLDVQEGVVVYWHENGNLKRISHYSNGELVIPPTEFDLQGIPLLD